MSGDVHICYRNTDEGLRIPTGAKRMDTRERAMTEAYIRKRMSLRLPLHT